MKLTTLSLRPTWLARFRSNAPMAGSLLSGVVMQAALMVSGVLVARMLGVEDRGYLALLMVTQAIISQLGGLGLPISASYFVAREPGGARAIAHSLAGAYLVQALCVVGVHLVAVSLLTRDDPETVWSAGLITLAIGPAWLAHQYGLGLLQGQQRFRPFNLLRLIPVGAYAAGILLLFVVGAGNLILAAVAYSVAWVAAGSVTITIALVGMRHDETALSPSRREVLRFGLRGLLGSAAPSETFRLDQAVVGLFLSPAALGLYVVGLAFTNLPRFIGQSVGMVAYPRVSSSADSVKARHAVWRFVALAGVLALLVVGVLEILAGWLIPFFFGEEFTPAVPLVRILLIAAAFGSLRWALADAVRGVGLPALGSVAELASWLTLPLALVVLVPLLGVQGVAFAMVLSAIASVAMLVVGFVAVSREPTVGLRWIRARVLTAEGRAR
ncbi:MAG: oligosaccharide flippase family protein [Thermoleophilaceae bacterium]|nr:oligosaccharide flippase family protein [Thermoleophilaceae bacterium]